MAQLTRPEMEAVIAAGGSVLYQGQTLWKLSQLPEAAELAGGDPEAVAAVQLTLETQIAHLQQQVAGLATRNQAAEESPPDPDPDDKKPTKKAAADKG